ncbi:hypothetical protein CIW52_16285 [Mycolicibacterium sp. P9-64]|nr:hypothetical protein CIW52_16285 [Mycolicibacterium sp. P9-64]
MGFGESFCSSVGFTTGSTGTSTTGSTGTSTTGTTGSTGTSTTGTTEAASSGATVAVLALGSEGAADAAGAFSSPTSFFVVSLSEVASPAVRWVDVSAPPELSTFIAGTRSLTGAVSSFGDDPSDEVSVVVVCDVVSVSGFDASGLVSGSVFGPGDAEAPGSESASGAAHATPGVVATATPTPRDTANAPMRPTYLA